MPKKKANGEVSNYGVEKYFRSTRDGQSGRVVFGLFLQRFLVRMIPGEADGLLGGTIYGDKLVE